MSLLHIAKCVKCETQLEVTYLNMSFDGRVTVGIEPCPFCLERSKNQVIHVLKLALLALESCHYDWTTYDDSGEETEIQVYDEEEVKKAIEGIKQILK